MSFRVDLTSRAERDVDAILGWIHERSPQGAATWYRRWNEVLRSLLANAGSCPLAPENDDHDEEIRHIVFKTRRGRRYRALFVIRDSRVFVIHVRGPGQNVMSREEVRLPE